MRIALGRLIGCESGATAIEYAFIAILISTAAVAAFTAVGTSLSSVFASIPQYL